MRNTNSVMRNASIVLFGILLLLSNKTNAETKVYFSPNGGCTNAIVREIARAQKTIDVMMYSFTSRPIVQAMDQAKARGVAIRVLLDKGQETQKYAKGRYFVNKGINVRYDTGAGLMHNKVGIIDGRILFTGSFNWTAQAEARNAENLLVIDDPVFIKKYQERFNSLWAKGRTP